MAKNGKLLSGKWHIDKVTGGIDKMIGSMRHNSAVDGRREPVVFSASAITKFYLEILTTRTIPNAFDLFIQINAMGRRNAKDDLVWKFSGLVLPPKIEGVYPKVRYKVKGYVDFHEVPREEGGDIIGQMELTPLQKDLRRAEQEEFQQLRITAFADKPTGATV